MKLQQLLLITSVLVLSAMCGQPLKAEESIIYMHVGPAFPTSLGEQRIFGIEDVDVDVTGKALAQIGALVRYGKHVNAGARLCYTQLEYEYDFSGLENPPFALPDSDESAVLIMQGQIEYHFYEEGFTPFFGITGGFIFGGPDVEDDEFATSTQADFIFGFNVGITFPLAPELRAYALVQGDYPLSTDILPNIYAIMGGIAFELDGF